MDPPRYDQLAPSALYELLRVHRQNLEILTLQAAKFTGLYQPPYLQHNLDETSVAIERLSADIRRRGLNPDAPPAGTASLRRQAIMAPRIPEGFIDRPAELEQLLATILDTTRTQPVAITTALQGAGGVGKTTLAAALCHTPSVITAFPDGILWVTLGEAPRLMDGLSKLCDALAPERPGFVDEEQAAITLTTLLQDRRCLIVLDDVWKPEHLRPFLRGTTRCTWLITTRMASVAAAARPVLVATMTADEAVQLLTNRLPTPPADTAPFRDLARRLGAWPLLLELAGSALRARVERGELLAAALQAIHKLLDKRGVVAFDQRDAQERHQAVATTLALSLNLLSPEERAAYTDLAVFPEDVDVPLVTLGRLWDRDDLDTEEVALRLDSLSLLKLNLQTRTIRLHDMLRTFLIHQAGPALPALHQRLLDAYAHASWAQLPHDEPYLWRQLIMHLLGAGRQAEIIETVMDLHYVATKAVLCGTILVEQDLQAAADSAPSDQVLALLVRSVRQMTHLLARCASVNDGAATLYSRLQHLAPLAPLLPTLTTALHPPILLPWHALPDVPHPALVRTLTTSSGRMVAVAITADASCMVSTVGDATLQIWDVRSGTVQATLSAPVKRIQDCAISAQGDRILAASGTTITIWDAHTGSIRRILRSPGAQLTSVALSADGTSVVATMGDAPLPCWDARTGSIQATLTGHAGSLTCCAISTDGAIVVAAAADGSVVVWKRHTQVPPMIIPGPSGPVTRCAISADGAIIVTATGDTLQVWTTQTGACIATLRGHTQRVNDCAISADGAIIVSAADDHTVRLWDAHTGSSQATFTGHTHGVRGCAVSADGRSVVSIAADRTIKVWTAYHLDAHPAPPEHTRRVNGCAISADGQHVVSASADRTVKRWTAATGTVAITLRGHTGTVVDCAISGDGATVVSAAADHTLHIWTPPAGKVRILTGHTHVVNGCALSSDGHLLVSAATDRTLRLWDVHTGTILGTLTGHARPVRSCAITADGRLVVSASDDHTLKFWDTQTGTLAATLRGHQAGVWDCAISADGRIIVSASNDHTLNVWDTATGRVQASLSGHTGPVIGCALSADSRRIASASKDGSLKVWAWPDAQCLATFLTDGPLHACAWHPDGEHLIAAGQKGVYFLRFGSEPTGMLELNPLPFTDG